MQAAEAVYFLLVFAADFVVGGGVSTGLVFFI